jgi:type IX secretion system PorP/SprF family membrane protein
MLVLRQNVVFQENTNTRLISLNYLTMQKYYLLIFFAFSLLGQIGSAQNIYFSQFQQTPLLTNPAMVSSQAVMEGGFLYRSQQVGGGQAFSTPLVYSLYPFFSKKTNQHWASVGVQILSDNAGIGGLMRTTGGSLAFSYNFYLPKNQQVSAGLQGGFFTRNIFLEKLNTGSQWNDIRRTFDSSLPNNLASLNPNVKLPMLDAGILWQIKDTNQLQRAYFGIAAKQINQPNDTFTDVRNPIPMVLVFIGGLKAYENQQISVYPNFRHIQQGKIRQTNLGFQTRYQYGQETKQTGFIALNTWYSIQNTFIAGIEVAHQNYFFNFAFDFSSTRPQNLGTANGAAEIGLGYRKYLTKKPAKKPQKPIKKDTIVEKPELLDLSIVIPEDSVLVYTEKEGLTAEEFDVFQRSVLFPYATYLLSEGNKAFLDKIASTLLAKPDLRVEISGHTCNLGKENDFIAKARAVMVYNYLIRKGIDKKRLVARAWGSKKPIAPNAIEAGRVRNRRVEFRLITF